MTPPTPPDPNHSSLSAGSIDLRKTLLVAAILRIAAKHEITDQIWWNEELDFFVPCNDVFAWGGSDVESVEDAVDIELFDRSCQEADFDGPHLYCARRRKIRPQGAVYEDIQPEHWPLFDACGPVREVGFCNPRKHPDETTESEQKTRMTRREFSSSWNALHRLKGQLDSGLPRMWPDLPEVLRAVMQQASESLARLDAAYKENSPLGG